MRYTVRFVVPGAAHVHEETMEASSLEELRTLCTAQGRMVLAVTAASPPRAQPRFDVSWWCRELRTLLQSGMTVVEAMDTLAAAHGDVDRDRVHAALLRSLRQGQSLSRAMRDTGAFPKVLVAGVTASERTSTLADTLDDYLRYDEMLGRLRRQAVSAAMYPAIVIGLGALIMLFLLVFVIPRFSRMYVDSNGELSGATQFVLWLSQIMQHRLPLVLGAIAILLVSAIVAVRSGAATRALAALVERVEPLRRQWDQFRLASLFQSLALMFRGGYTVNEALEVGEGLQLGTRMTDGLRLAREEIARGRNASAALAAAGLTETVTERLLAAGERTGAFDSVLQTIADRHAQAFSTFVERATRIVEPLLLLLVALVVGGIVVMMYMPIFDMAGSLGAGR